MASPSRFPSVVRRLVLATTRAARLVPCLSAARRIAPHPGRWTGPLSILLLALTGILAPGLQGSADATPTASNPGRWTSRHDSGAYWPAVPVHMMLLPPRSGDSLYHSQILWYQEDEGNQFFGGVWGWRSSYDTVSTMFPDTQFTALPVKAPPVNVFCSGHAQVGSELLVAGGTEAGSEVGIRNCMTFDPLTSDTSSQWTVVDSLDQRRWYPTVTALPSGDALITSGSKYNYMRFWGDAGTTNRHHAQLTIVPTARRLGAVTPGVEATP